jgi:hypothetical protein
MQDAYMDIGGRAKHDSREGGGTSSGRVEGTRPGRVEGTRPGRVEGRTKQDTYKDIGGRAKQEARAELFVEDEARLQGRRRYELRDERR